MPGSARTGEVLRGIAFEEKGLHIAVCIDRYLVTQAKSKDDLPGAILNMLIAHAVACREFGFEPFADLPPAPARYWKMYEEMSEGEALRPEAPEDLFPWLPPIEFRETYATAA